MLVSYSELKKLVNLPDVQTVCNDLTMLGLEVDACEPVCPPVSDKIVVGQVVECAQHPDADKLRVTKVDVGGPELLDIVCGAPNCRQGLKVVVATIGAVLPGDFKIKAAKLRGQPSNGMLCSYKELGINIEAEGIIELAPEAKVGTLVSEYLDTNDHVIEISLTANRPDCLSQVGVARDLGAYYGLTGRTDKESQVYAPEHLGELATETWHTNWLKEHPVTSHDEIFPVEVLNDQACPLYASRVINNVNVKAQTPDWMVQFLARVGVRSIDPIVDITNYVLHFAGQPLHAFDKAKLHDKIVVRNAEQDEKITLLSGQEAVLDPSVLVISDTQGPVALAGIFGGLDSGVTAETTDVVLEAAHFAPLAIVNRARKFGLHTDASHRFERGVAGKLTLDALETATQLVLQICGGQAGPINAVGQAPSCSSQVKLTHKLVERIAGIAFSPVQVRRYLEATGCQVHTHYLDGRVATEHAQEAEFTGAATSGLDLVSHYEVVTASWRFDLAIPEDLCEEVLRLHGYDNVPNEPPAAQLNMRTHSEAFVPTQRFKDLLVAKGFQEVVTYSFVDPKLQGLFHKEPALVLPNPISVEMSAMRLSLATSLVTTLANNQKRQQKRVRIFEAGLTFVPDANAELGVAQELQLGGLLTGSRYPEGWNVDKANVDFFDAKGVVEDLLNLTKVKLDTVRFVPVQKTGFHPGQTAEVYAESKGSKTLLGYVGKLHPALAKPFGVSGDVFVFELALKHLDQTFVPQIANVSKFPANLRDIALVLDADVAVGELLLAAKQAGSNLLQNVELFDLFVGESLGAGKKSAALTLTIGADDRTLNDEETAAEVQAVVDALAAKFGAVLRD